jgi:hypothetical protein
MTKRLALTPAVGLFAGLSVVSYGAVSMLITGVHGSAAHSTNPCAVATSTPTPTATPTATPTRTAARSGTRVMARAQHPAGMPVLLADVVPAGQVTPSSAGSAPSAGSNSPSPSTLPQPAPAVAPAPSPAVAQPGPAQQQSTQNPPSPGGPLATPSTSASPTPTTSASPTPTSTPTAPTGTLCLTVQTLNSVSAVDPGTTVGYAIWVWLTSGTDGSAKITLTTSPSGLTPTFSVCATTGKSDCTVGGLNAGQQVEVQAQLTAPARTVSQFTLTASASSALAANTATASATVTLKPKNSPAPTPGSGSAGNGGVLPPGSLPGGPSGPFPNFASTPGNLGSAFPQVSPTPGGSSSSSSSGTAQDQANSPEALDVSAGLPLTVRLIGGQVIGLAILAAAVTIAVARLSLRRQPPRHGEDTPGT